MEEVAPDIVAKYHKLAAEYSKLRAQVTVLKRAVSDEQGRNQDLKEALKEKDQSVRKLQQEVECLNFRNLQLTKRVSVLQNDLEATEEKLKKSKNKNLPNSSFAPSENSSILNTELLSRIEESERLHQQVFEAEVEHKRTVVELTSKVETLQSELERQHLSLSETIKKHETTIEKLSQERAKLELTLKNHEKNIKDVKLKDEMCKQELQFVKQDLGTKLDEANRILEEKIPFNDTRWKFQNSLTVPVLLNSKHNQLSTMIGEIKGVIMELVRKLSDLHTYMEQKLINVDLNYEITGPVKRLANILHENPQYLKQIEVTFSEFSIKVQKDSSLWLEVYSLANISKAFSKYVRYLEKLLPYLLLSIQTEDAAKGTTPRLKEIYKKFQVIVQNLVISFSKLERYLELLVETSCPNKSSTFCISRPVLVNKILTSLNSLHSQFEDARKVFSAKVVLDHQLPTSTEIAKTTDDCILSSMVSIANNVKKVAVLIEEKRSILDSEIPYRPRGAKNQKQFLINPCVPAFQARGIRYIKLLQESEPLSIPYELALKNSQTLSSFADGRENLSQQPTGTYFLDSPRIFVSSEWYKQRGAWRSLEYMIGTLKTCQNKLAKIEMDKEHWMLECQLLKTRQSRASPLPSEGNSDSSPEDEQTLQVFMKDNINQLVTQMQCSDSKALAFQTECECVYQKLKLTEQKNEKLSKQFSEASGTIGTLKEEQRTLMKNYEDQLSMMSEHLATMNETLTLQKDEIDALKHAGNNKTSKKNKGK